MHPSTRRRFLQQSLGLGAACLAAGPFSAATVHAKDAAKDDRLPGGDMSFGLVTYQWGKDWSIPTLLTNCQAAGLHGVELRTEHAHKVEPTLSADDRAKVKKQFAGSPVTLVSLGTNQAFHHPDPKALAKSIEGAKAFLKLGHDVGASGVKVKPDALPKDVPVEKTIEQIGKSLNTLGAFGADYGQQVRLEVHGGCARLPIIERILQVADHPNVAICWNSNVSDLQDGGLETNFKRVRARFGGTAHVRTLDSRDYPFGELIRLFVKSDYRGWILLEAGGSPKGDPVQALIQQRKLFEQMVADARK